MRRGLDPHKGNVFKGKIKNYYMRYNRKVF